MQIVNGRNHRGQFGVSYAAHDMLINDNTHLDGRWVLKGVISEAYWVRTSDPYPVKVVL